MATPAEVHASRSAEASAGTESRWRRLKKPVRRRGWGVRRPCVGV